MTLPLVRPPTLVRGQDQLLSRTIVACGETTVYDLEGRSRGDFAHKAPDTALVDDRRVM